MGHGFNSYVTNYQRPKNHPTAFFTVDGIRSRWALVPSMPSNWLRTKMWGSKGTLMPKTSLGKSDATCVNQKIACWN